MDDRRRRATLTRELGLPTDAGAGCGEGRGSCALGTALFISEPLNQSSVQISPRNDGQQVCEGLRQ